MPTNARVNVQKDNVTDALSSSVVVPTGEALTIASGGSLTAEAGSIVNIPASGITGLGTMATQDADNVAITGGSITGITALAVADGGTGATNATDARVNLGVNTTGSSILYGDGAGAFSNVTIGSGVSFADGTLSATGTGGSVTSVSVNTANGISGNVDDPTTTPAITLSLGEITPTSVNSVVLSGSDTPTLAVTGTSDISGTNTGNQTISITGDVTAADSQDILTATVTKINGTSLAGLTTGILKNTTGTGVPSIAVSGSDYAPATSGSAILHGNSAGGFSNVAIGSGVSFTGGTLSATGNGGTVTSISVLAAHGVSATISNPTTTPALTFTLGAITPSSVNSVTLSGSATPTLAVTGTSTISGTNTGNQTISITGDVTAAGSQNTLTSTVTKINGQALATLSTGILKNTTSTGVPSIAVAADFPTLNQNTSGNAATATNVAVTGVTGLGTGVASFLQTPTSANLSSMVTDETGSGNLVFSNSPVLVTPNLDTPSAITLSNATGLPLTTGVTGTLPVANGGTGVTTSTGTGSVVLSASPTLTGTPAAPTAANGTNTTQIATTQYVQSNRGDKYLTTSNSTNTIDNGNGKTFNCSPDLSYIPTQAVTIVYDLNNHMHCTVVSYSSSTGAMVVNSDSHSGSGTYSAWTINLGGLTSAGGALLSANNLSDVASVSTSRTNLGVTATGQDTTYLYRANNLSDLSSVTTARTNLGLGTMATQNSSSVSISGGTVDNVTLVTPTISSIVNTGTLTLPNQTDTLVGRATTDTLTNKTLTSPVMTTPSLGVASATSVNKVAVTAPATGSTLTIVDGATLTASATATVSGTNTGDQTISITGDVTASGSTGALSSTVTKVNGTSLAGLATGILKNTTGTGAPSIAVSGSDYAPATSGSSILYGNSAGGFSNVTVGSGISFAGGTLSATGSGGSVTSVSVTTSNGVSGSVANPTTTPAISLTLGAITPTSVNSVILSGSATPTLAVTGTSSISGSSSGANTGDQTISITGDVTAAGSTGALSSTVTKINGTSLASLATGILKNTTTTGVPTIAVAGTDYAPATSGSSILYGNGAGGFSPVTVGSGLSFSAGTLASTAGGGSVTSVSGTGTVNGITLSGTVTSSGNLTLGGTLDLSSPPAIGGTTAAAGTFTDLFGTTFSNGFTSVAAAGTVTTLTATSVRDWTVTGSGGQTYQLPDATTLRNGAVFQFNNNQSSGTIVVRNNSATTVVTIQSGGYVEVILLSNATAAGSWDVHNQAPSNVTWSTNTFDYPGSITSATWNGTAVALNRGGTGQTTAQAAINNLAGATTSGYYLRGNGTNVVMAAISAGDVPTLNQNTTGSAATLATPRAIYGNNFDGSAALTNVIASTYGGTGNGFTKFSGPATAEKTFTLPDSNATLLYSGGALGTPSSGTLTSATGLPVSTGISGLGTGVATALAVNVGSAGAPVVNGGALGTPSSGTLTSATGLPLTTGVTGILPAANGGTGVANNAAMTVTGSGNFAYTRTLTAATNVTFPTTGTLATLAGSETLTNKTLTGAAMNGTLGATTPSTVAATTLAVSSTSSFTTSAPSVPGGFGYRNRIINGDMRIDQANAGASITVNNGGANYSTDQWIGGGTGSAGAFTLQQSTSTPPSGFSNFLRTTVSTADASPAAGSAYQLYTKPEGLNLQDFQWGSAGAKTVTLSFWVRSSLTGTFSGSFRSSNAGRSYPFSYTISSASTWEYKTITVVGDTSGTWATDNTTGMFLTWDMGSGSTFLATAGAWTSSNIIGVTSAVRLISTLSATFDLTGVQLEVGSAATSFEVRDYATELVRCQRYCYVIRSSEASDSYNFYGLAKNLSSTNSRAFINFPVKMRAIPTISYSAVTDFLNVDDITNSTVSAISLGSANLISATIDFTLVSSSVTGTFGRILSNNNRTGWLLISARL